MEVFRIFLFLLLSFTHVQAIRQLEVNEMNFTCVPDDDRILHPVCPGREDGQYCDGALKGDCTRDFCDCNAGRNFCATGENPCSMDCHAYVEKDYIHLYAEDMQARPMCSTTDDFGEIPYGDLSCCDNAGFSRTTSSSGFDFRYSDTPNITQSGTCQSHVAAISSMICDPKQKDYVKDNTLSVCLSSCEALFNACGLPGEYFHIDMNYNDAKSLCENSWGDPEICIYRSTSFACRSQIFSVQVVESNTDCLDMVFPTDNEVANYNANKYRSAPDCENKGMSAAGYGIEELLPTLAGLLIFLGMVAYLVYRFNLRSKESGNGQLSYPGAHQNQMPGSSPGGQGTMNNGGTEQPQFIDNPTKMESQNEVIPTAPPVAPSAPAPVTSFSDEDKPESTDNDAKPSLFDQLNAQLDDNKASEEVAPAELSFLQQLELRELEDKKKYGNISDEEYERKKNAILYDA